MVSVKSRGFQFLSNVSVVAGATCIAQLGYFFITPALTRLYEPADFGTYGFYIGVISILAVVASGRYEVAMPLPRGKMRRIY